MEELVTKKTVCYHTVDKHRDIQSMTALCTLNKEVINMNLKEVFCSRKFILRIILIDQIIGYVLLQLCFERNSGELRAAGFLVTISIKVLLAYLWMWHDWRSIKHKAGTHLAMKMWTVVFAAEYILNVNGLISGNRDMVLGSLVLYGVFFEINCIQYKRSVGMSLEMVQKQPGKREMGEIILLVCSLYAMAGLGFFSAEPEEIAGILVVTFLLYGMISACLMVRFEHIWGHWLKGRDILLYYSCYAGAVLAGVLSRTDVFCHCFYHMDKIKAAVLGGLIQWLLLLGTVKIWLLAAQRIKMEAGKK